MDTGSIPLGERDGFMFRAHEVENGLRCGCTCPGCQKPLVAANKGKKRLPYFRHAGAAGCANGRTEGVRRAAVQVIVARKELLLPGYSGQVSLPTKSGRVLSKAVCFAPKMISADTVERFVTLDGLRAHALIAAQQHRLAVRIKVSTREDHERKRRLKENALSSMEIDLSRLGDEQVTDKTQFEQAVLQDPQNRTWIRTLRGELLAEHALTELAEQVRQVDLVWMQSEAERLAEEQARALEKKKLQERLEQENRERRAALAAHRAEQLDLVKHQVRLEETALQEQRKHREEQIVATMWTAARKWEGKGYECECCRLINPPAARFCMYCTAEHSLHRAVSYTAEDLERTLVHRLRCTAAPSDSLKKVPKLTVEPGLDT